MEAWEALHPFIRWLIVLALGEIGAAIAVAALGLGGLWVFVFRREWLLRAWRRFGR